MADPTLLLWDELEAAEAKVGDGSANASSKNARHALERLRRQVRPGGSSAGDKHSVARFRTQVASIVAFVTDATAPSTSILSGPAAGSTFSGTTATFTFDSDDDDVSFEVKLDGGAYGAPSGPGNKHVLTGLSAAAHTFYVRATDSAGNVDASPATRAFTTTP